MKKDETQIQIIQSDVPVYQQTELAQIDAQVATAKQYPRNLKRAKENIVAIATMSKEAAASCGYVLPRGNKKINGPSVHLAKIVAQQYGNLRVQAKCVEISDKFVKCEGVAHDLETNFAAKVEVSRKITDRNGQRFNDDMVNVTINAANSIAFRNAVYAVVPRDVVQTAYDAAQNTITGDLSDETKLKNKRTKIIKEFKDVFAVTEDEILATIGKQSVDFIDKQDIANLVGLWQALKDGDTTVDDAFGRTTKKEQAKTEDFDDDKPVGETLEMKPAQ
nr:hypothetical protein 4 [bacterium]